MATTSWSNKAVISTPSWYHGTLLAVTSTLDLPLTGDGLLGCCCRAKCQGEDTYSASTEEQAHTVCLQKKSHSPSPGTVRPEGDATLCKPAVWHFILSNPVPTCEIWPVADEHCQKLWGQCGLSLSPRVLLTPWSTPSPSSCNLFSQISDKFLWLPASLSCTKHFCPSPSSTVFCNRCSKLRHVPNEAPFLPSMCRHPTPIN